MRRGARLLALLACTAPATARAQGSAYEQLQSFSGVLSQIRANYVDSVETGALVRAAITGMLESLDPHSYYVSRADFERRAAWLDGRLGATGINLEDGDDGPVVLSVEPGSPAARAGVLPGDRVVAVDDSSTAGLRARRVELRLIGEKGSKVRLRLERGPRLEPATLAVNLKRATLEPRVVQPGRLVGAATGYVRLAEFTPRAPDELRQAIRDLQGKGAKQLVLDLRGNPGGSVEAMIAIASDFLPRDTVIFRAQGRKKSGLELVRVTKAGDFRMPLVLLVDEGSASASEMLAGALQDHDRALIVGRRSFGKALMQAPFPLPNGDVVWLTIARVGSPSGRIIQRRYTGLVGAQYFERAGTGGAESDTMPEFHTDHGRLVRGGGGIRPDVLRPAAELPTWFSVAADTGLVVQVADSVAQAQPVAGKDAWLAGGPDRWDREVVVPFLTRVRAALGVTAEPDAALRARLGRILASRVAEVRWGPDAAEEFRLRTDPDLLLALEQFPRLGAALGGK